LRKYVIREFYFLCWQQLNSSKIGDQRHEKHNGLYDINVIIGADRAQGSTLAGFQLMFKVTILT